MFYDKINDDDDDDLAFYITKCFPIGIQTVLRLQLLGASPQTLSGGSAACTPAGGAAPRPPYLGAKPLDPLSHPLPSIVVSATIATKL